MTDEGKSGENKSALVRVPDAIVSAPVEGISGVWKFRRAPGGYHRARSLPGHLLHLLTRGGYRLRTNGREYDVRAGDVIYYHETEEVEWLGNAEEVEFISVGFLAPALDPLPLDARVFPAGMEVRAAFGRVYEASLLPRGMRRRLAEHAALLDILWRIEGWGVARPGAEGTAQPEGEPGPVARSWRQLESLLRERKRFRSSLDEMGRLANMSRATLVRACRAATGASPMKRLQELRMIEARGLLKFSTLNVSQVAEYLGYPRVHEFSREFARYFGHPPSRRE